jgi:cell pole-organizing protein PopZ
MSAASAKTQEPSMEEILASIRRIIAEDQDVAKEQEQEQEPAAEEKPAPEPEPEAEAEPDDVLDLSESVTSAALAAELDAELAAAPPAAALPDLDVAVPEIEFSDEPEAPEPTPLPPQPEPPRPLEAVLRAAASERAPEALEDSAITEALISNAAGASVGQAFNMLSHTVLTRNARTLEDLVKDMLKPMLKMWLDDNLPPLVERLVRAEIERVARGRN